MESASKVTQRIVDTVNAMTIRSPKASRQGDAARRLSGWHEATIARLLERAGMRVEREPRIGTQTPDLLVHSADGDAFVVECVARARQPGHRPDGDEQTGCRGCTGDVRGLHRNIYSRLQTKATKYRAITANQPYVIALLDDGCGSSIETAVDMTLSNWAPTYERNDDGTIRGKHYNTLWPSPEVPAALFELYPHVSGMLFSQRPSEHHYIQNPWAVRPLGAENFPFAGQPAIPSQYETSQRARAGLATPIAA